MKIYICHNVCERRIFNLKKIIHLAMFNGHEIVTNFDVCDVVLFIACGMKDLSIEGFITSFCNKRILVYGCYTDMVKKRLSRENIKYISLKDENVLFADLKIKNFDLENIACSDSIENLSFKDVLSYWDPRQKIPYCKDVYTLLISKGCNMKCTYCTIRNATGKLISRKSTEIINEFLMALKAGYKYFNLQCENLGTYGQDIDENLGILLEKFSEIDKKFFINLPDLYPLYLVNYFKTIRKLFIKGKVYLMHVPIQSGSQRILNLMNRYYSISDVSACFKDLFSLNPRPLIGTDVIAGFPTEDFNDYLCSHDILWTYDFNWIYLHGYNEKDGADSKDIFPKVSCLNIEKRIKYSFEKNKNIACYLNNYRASE